MRWLPVADRVRILAGRPAAESPTCRCGRRPDRGAQTRPPASGTGVSIDIAAARHCAQLTARLYRGRDMPERLRRHIAALMSDIGPDRQAQQQQSTYEPIGIAAAARILKCTPRHARRIAADLDGVRIDGNVWVFHRDAVVAYAQAKAQRGQHDDCA